MKKTIYIIILLFLNQWVNAQIHEVGVFGGGSNFIGDVGKTNYISPSEPAFGLLYKWNKNPRYSWRFSAILSNLKGNDAKSDLNSRKERNYFFENKITEFSAGFEFNFFDFNLHKSENISTPYLHTGLVYFITDDLYVLDNNFKVDDRSGSLAIPMTLGYKIKIAHSWVLGLEAGARFTFSDDIDGSNPKNNDFENIKFGNTNSNDWYTFTGLTLSYTFGKKPCYCSE